MPVVCLGLPWYQEPAPETVLSLINTLVELSELEVRPLVAGAFRVPLPGHARAILVAKFLHSTNDPDDRLLMIDHDMTWKLGAVARMLRHDEPMVCAAGPDKRTRQFFAGLTSSGVTGVGQARYDGERGLLNVDRCGLCFALLKRSLFLQLAKAYQELHLHRQGGITPDLIPFHYAFFENRAQDGGHPSEDFAFCDRVRALDIPIYLDVWITLGHVVTEEFKGRMFDSLDWEEGFPPPPPDDLGDV